MKLFVIISTILFLIVSCRPDHKNQHQDNAINFELIKIGHAEHPDTGNNHFIGAGIYMRSIPGDSVYVKLNEINPVTGEPDSISRNYAVPLCATFENALHGVIVFMDSTRIKDGEIPGTDPGPNAIYCGGSYILAYRNKEGKMRSLFFRHHHLYLSFDSLLNEQYQVTHELDKHQPNTHLFWDTDSITRYYYDLLKLQDRIISPPPLRSTVKFTPPGIKN
ncbi:MAG: hypothetical protein V4658_06525 [Bacteroidota bacterium]